VLVNYRRVLLLTELGEDVAGEAAAIRRVAPHAERLVVVTRTPAVRFAWLAAPAPADLNDAATASLERLRREVAELAPSVEVTLVPDLEADPLTRVAEQESIDLVVTDLTPIGDSAAIAELRRRRGVALLWAATDRQQSEEIVCIAVGRRAAASVAAFLRDHGDPSLHATILTTSNGDRSAAALEIAGIDANVKIVEAGVSSLRAIASGDHRAALIVVARIPPPLMFGACPPASVLVLPPLTAPSSPFVRAIDVPDLVDQSGTIRLRVDYAAGAGRNSPIPDQDVALVARGRIATVVRTANGQAELPASMDRCDSLGVFRLGEGPVAEPLAAIEALVTIVRPRPRPLMLFDADVCDEDLSHIARFAGADLIGVRMRPMKSCRSLRTRLHAAGIDAPVVDASVVLDEGDAFDVPDAVDPVRLARVGARLRADGFPVVAIVHRGPHPPLTIGFTALTADQLEGTSWQFAPQRLPRSLDDRLDAITGAPLLEGNLVDLELDNTTARRWLLDAIAASRERIHLQVYAVSDDEVGRGIEEALASAGARGARVRVLVDSLHTLHGVLGATNPLLERLGAKPGVELRVSRPITGVPSLEDLKQRDHKKLAVIDGSLALVGGRNLSHEYYTGFDEMPLDEKSMWREVPWLDAGARVEGPAVNAIEEAFREAWLDAGGSAFDIAAASPRGATAVRVVVHRGLRDARTLEAYLALIDTATSHVYAVNGFPLILEIQHALLRALARGVRVRTLFGHVTPTHDGQPFGGAWSSARSAATELVHSRMDALVAAGAEAYQFAVRPQPRWAPTLGTVSPHVHAKVMSIDGRACAVGSANLDITAGYWESELLLLIEDELATRTLEARIEELIATSHRVDREDPEWQKLARRREWMRHWPGMLSV
jgi:phosphatidylserine/phosphatidylglycerophosphate/cardiolipin synthase-like enzyme